MTVKCKWERDSLEKCQRKGMRFSAASQREKELTTRIRLAYRVLDELQ